MSVAEAPAPGKLACARCGQEHLKCAAHKVNGQPCGIAPMRGLKVCRRHGGATPAAKRKHERFVAWEATKGAFVSLGIQADVDPAQALLAMVREAAGNVAFYRWRIQQLDQAEAGPEGLPGLADLEHWLDLSQGERDALQRDTGSAIALRVDPANWRAEMHVLVRAYDRERDTLVKYAKLACDAGVQERLVRAVEQDAGEIVRIVRAALQGVELTEAQQLQVRDQLRQALEAQSRREGSLPLPAVAKELAP